MQGEDKDCGQLISYKNGFGLARHQTLVQGIWDFYIYLHGGILAKFFI